MHHLEPCSDVDLGDIAVYEKGPARPTGGAGVGLLRPSHVDILRQTCMHCSSDADWPGCADHSGATPPLSHGGRLRLLQAHTVV
jgi:hypothetical protein